MAMCHVFMIRHGYKVLCVISIVILLLKLFDNSVLGGPHSCDSEIKSVSLLKKKKSLVFVCRLKTLKSTWSSVSQENLSSVGGREETILSHLSITFS